MKKPLLLLLLLGFVSFSFAQDKFTYNQDLLAVYSSEELDEMMVNNVAELDFLEYYLENGYVIKGLPQEKYDAQNFIEIEKSYADKPNFMELEGFSIEMDERKVLQYKIKGTTQLLVVLSAEKVRKNYETSLK